MIFGEHTVASECWHFLLEARGGFSWRGNNRELHHADLIGEVCCGSEELVLVPYLPTTSRSTIVDLSNQRQNTPTENTVVPSGGGKL